MKKIVRLTESDLIRIVKQVLNEESDVSVGGKPKGYDEFQKKCITKNKGSFRTYSSNRTLLKCTKTEGSFFHPEERDSLWVNNNPYNPKDTGINGSWKFENGKITLHSALKGDKTL
jgi:hypothetical protein